MKSLEELIAIREQMRDKVAIRHGFADTKVVVSMGTCGIAAGARPVLTAFVEEVAKSGLAEKVTVTQCGCIGECSREPVVNVTDKDGKTVTYVNMTPEKVKRVVEEHLAGGKPVAEFTEGNL